MAAPTPIMVPDARKPKSLLGLAAAFGIHTIVVYTSAVYLSSWLVFHWFGWVASILQISVNVPATDWYLQHLEIVTVIPAIVLGYLNVTRFFPVTIRSYIGEVSLCSIAPWAWCIPALILGCKMLLYHAPSSVLLGTSMSTIEYFFDIQKSMPTMSNPLASDPIRVLGQMTVTAPFYAGLAYSVAAVASRRRLLSKVLTPEKYDEPSAAPDS